MITQHINNKAIQIKQKIKKNNIVASICVACSVSLFVPAFTTKGSLTDYVSFCFQPSEVHDPYIYKEKISKSFMRDKQGKYILDAKGRKKIVIKRSKYIIGKRFCNEKTTKKGISHIVAQEIEDSLEFKSKVKIRGRLKAKNPHAGLFGIGAGLIMGIGSVIFWSATREVEDNQDSLLHIKRSQMLKDALYVEHDLDRNQHSTKVETEYIKKGIEEELKYQYVGDDPPYPQELLDKQKELDTKNGLLRDTSIELELASMKAELAEKRKKELEQLKEIEKLTKTVKEKITDKHSHTEGDNKQESKDDLINKLKEHEGGWLYTLIESIKPLWVSGDAGSGKSTFAVSIMLCRHYLLDHKLECIVDPEYNKNVNTKWKYLSFLEPKVYGEILSTGIETNSEWEDVNTGLVESMERWRIKNEKSPFASCIMDEVTQYSLQEECKKSASKMIPLLAARPRKANEGFIGIAHAMSNAATGGSEGYSSTIKNGSFIVHLRTKNQAEPLFKGKLEGYKDDNGEVIKDFNITIPKEWFNPRSIKEMFK